MLTLFSTDQQGSSTHVAIVPAVYRSKLVCVYNLSLGCNIMERVHTRKSLSLSFCVCFERSVFSAPAGGAESLIVCEAASPFSQLLTLALPKFCSLHMHRQDLELPTLSC